MQIFSKTSRTGVLAAVAVAVFSLGCASTRTAPVTPENTTLTAADGKQPEAGNDINQAIRSLLQTYQRSLNEANVDLVKSVYADDAVFIGQPFPTATGIDEIAALYADFLSKLDFDVEFEILEVELRDDLGFVRTQSIGTIVPKGQAPQGRERNREVFVVKKIDGAWKFYRYMFNPEV